MSAPSSKTQRARPIVAWAGSKRNVMWQLKPLIPARFAAYHEPFVGAGNFFMALDDDVIAGKEVFLSDTNKGIVALFSAAASEPEKLCKALRGADARFRQASVHQQKDMYLAARDRYNRMKRRGSIDNVVALAALFIVVCTLCFSSIYRENSQGLFTSPFGKFYGLVKDDQIGQLAARFDRCKRVKIACADFAEVIHKARRGDFVYLDPPYSPVTKNALRYTAGGFGEREQERVAEVFRALDAKGVFVMMSNSDAPSIRKLYRGFNIKRIAVHRYAHQLAAKGDVELVVRNY